MLWLSIAIACYFLFAVVFLADKYLLAGRDVNPKILVFFAGLAGILGFLLLPFGLVDFGGWRILAIAFIAGAARIFATYLYFLALRSNEVSRITTAINAIQPVISFWLIWFVSQGKAVFETRQLAAFALLIAGSVIVTADKSILHFKTIRQSLLSSFLFSLSFVLSKLVYDDKSQNFISAFALMGFGSLAASLLFLGFSDVRHALFCLPKSAKARSRSIASAWIFVLNQIIGATAFVMQNYAVSLAPLAFVAMINALAGTQHAFLLVLTVVLSLYFPKIIKEKITRFALIQKTAAVILILAGLAVFGIK